MSTITGVGSVPTQPNLPSPAITLAASQTASAAEPASSDFARPVYAGDASRSPDRPERNRITIDEFLFLRWKTPRILQREAEDAARRYAIAMTEQLRLEEILDRVSALTEAAANDNALLSEDDQTLTEPLIRLDRLV